MELRRFAPSCPGLRLRQARGAVGFDAAHDCPNAGYPSAALPCTCRLALCRYILRLPPVVAMSRAELVSWLGPTVQRYITGDAD